ncbi:hypothetical protein VPH35_088271 [Triticum aestivum]
MDLTIQLIEQITKSFSDDQKIGCGTYGEVYKGVHNGEEIAVKKLYNMQGIDDTEFTNEFRNLMKVKHPNIVRLIGYCYEIRHRHVEMNGDLVFAKTIEQLLCFEYMEGGSLAKHISGYMPPEFIDKRRITKKYDVFIDKPRFVGVIILQIMAGAQGYNNCCEMTSPQQFIELVHENWKKRLQGMPMQENTYLIDILAVQRCIELAVRCVKADPVKRPSIMDVVDELNKLDADIKNISLPGQETSDSKDLELDSALELRFPFELNRDISCCMQLINKTNEFVAFNIRTNKMKYIARPNNGNMAPYSKIYITFTLLAQDKEPPYMRCQDMLIVQSTRLSMESGDEITDEFFEKAVASRVVDEVKLPIVYVV